LDGEDNRARGENPQQPTKPPVALLRVANDARVLNDRTR
jgi:hypothetical protein